MIEGVAQVPSHHAQPVVSVRDLCVSIGKSDTSRIVDRISFDVAAGETFCIVGESGCGKSMTALALMGLAPTPPIFVDAQRLTIDGQDLLALSDAGMEALRGNTMAMIFQEPMTSLNPSFRIGAQIIEAIMRHQKVTKREARLRSAELLQLVGIPSPLARLRDYPHQLSGGMRQRVMIAMAIANRPKLLIADEPTTALDVTIQRQILSLIARIREETGTSIVLITHDLGVVAQVADTVAVMYAGQIVERAGVDTLFSNPLHPYTLGLLTSMPTASRRGARLMPIEGTVPSIDEMPPGCRFATRCPFSDAQCLRERPPEEVWGNGHTVSCWKAAEMSR